MGIFNRDYMGSGQRRGMLPAGWGATEVIMAINVAIFIAWQVLMPPAERGNPNNIMNLNFTLTWDGLKSGRIWTLITYSFSQSDLRHIFFNMFVFWMFGRQLERDWGRRPFVIFYLVCAVAGAVFTLTTYHLGLTGPSRMLGASAAVSGFLIAFSFLHKSVRIYLFGLIPMPAIVLALFTIAYDLYGLISNISAHINNVRSAGPLTGHGAHLGGAIIGILWTLHLTGKIRLPLPSLGSRTRRSSSRRRSSHPYPQASYGQPAAPRVSTKDERKMDALLAKVNEGGLDCLSAKEREFMIDMSRKLRDRQ